MPAENPPPPRARFPRPEVDLTVALCSCDGERWIGQFLDSLAAQERLPDELVVQDDASTDKTVEVVESFAARAPFVVRLEVNPTRLGSTANFATALGRSRGRFIALADQDDLWYPAKLRLLIGELESDATITMAFSNADLLGEDGRRLSGRLWRTRGVERVLRRHAVVPEELFARRALTTGCTMAVRRRAVEASLPFPSVLASEVAPMRHDRWLSLVAAAVGTVRAVPEPLLGFRVHPSQETGVLIGPQLHTAIVRSAVGVAVGDLARTAREHADRATQLRAAAERAEELGDFGEGTTLRRVAEEHDLRAVVATAPRASTRLRAVAQAARRGAYPPDPLGAAAVAADLIRACRPGRSA